MGNLKNRERKPSRKRKYKCRKEDGAKKQRKGEESRQAAVEAEEAVRPMIADSDTRQVAEEVRTPVHHASTSASARKINLATHMTSENQANDAASFFVMFDVEVLQTIFSSLSCPGCNQTCTLQLSELKHKKMGFCLGFLLQCSSCLWENKFMSSNSVADKNKKSFEVNLCMVLAFRNIGIGYDGMASFATTMNMNKPMTRKNYGNVIDLLHESYLAEAGASMMAAAEEVKAKTGTSDIAASFDGTWQKPGHASLNGVVTAISNKTGKVVDFDVRSKKCQSCVSKKHLDKDSDEYVAWWLEHESECQMNHTGSSGAMEVAGVRTMYQRSHTRYGLRYTTYIGDGDSSSYATIAGEKPYGDKIDIEKKQCVGHVQKRMGSRLRKLKANFGNRKLKGGKTIGGRGRLTNRIIDTMQNYYGLAIRKNPGDLNGMRNDIIAGLHHIASTDTKPQHSKCPKGANSWCGWQRDKANKTKKFKNTHNIDQAVVDEIKPIYVQLSDKALLSRCLDSFTQNPNESLNHLIWARCPKKVYTGKKVVELCAVSAVTHFNDGSASIAAVLGRLVICPGCYTNNGIVASNRKRLYLANKKSSEKVKNQ